MTIDLAGLGSGVSRQEAALHRERDRQVRRLSALALSLSIVGVALAGLSIVLRLI